MKIDMDGGIDWPAWVQAVGTIVAVIASSFVAILLERRRRKHEFLREQDQTYIRRLAVLAVIRRARDAIELLSAAVDAADDDSARLVPPRESLAQALQLVEIYLTRTEFEPRFVDAFVRVAAVLREVNAQAQIYGGSGLQWVNIIFELGRAKTTITEVEAALEYINGMLFTPLKLEYERDRGG